MLFFLTLLLAPVIPQDGAIINTSYVQASETEEDANKENKNEDDGVVLLSYNEGSSSGKIMNISKNYSEDEDNSKDSDNPVENPADAQEKSCNQSMEKEFADMRIIQLANNIAGDLGITTKVSLSR